MTTKTKIGGAFVDKPKAVKIRGVFYEMGNAFSILSPYHAVNWDTDNNYKTQFHTHTSETPNRNPSVPDNIQAHKEVGYKALAISDKPNKITKWSDFGVDAEEEGMTEIPNEEPAHTRVHTLKPFTDWVSTSMSFNDYIQKVGEEGGLIIITHPVGPSGSSEFSDYDPPTTFEHQVKTYPHVVGFDIIEGLFELNTVRPTGYTGFIDGGIDDYLVQIGREDDLRPFLTGTSDWHLTSDGEELREGGGVDITWSELLAPDRSVASLKEATIKGRMFWAYSPDGSDAAKINKVNMIGQTIALEIEGDYDEVRWVYNKETVKTGISYSASDLQEGQTYIRAEVWKYAPDTQWRMASGGYTKASVIGTQPFYFESN